jgi:uncharacterized protein YecE (DUF72 family)
MEIFAGTSGYSYKEWCGSFYPEKLPAAKMLGFYAQYLPAVEINNTFYRLPNAQQIASWAGQVPDGFRFVIKAARRITHIKRLKDVDAETSYLLQSVAGLGARLGGLLFQLPPYMRKDLTRLERFLELLPPATPAAFEFRDASWFDETVFACLRARDCALCIADTDKEPLTGIISTARWGYLRLRRATYSDGELTNWLERIRAHEWRLAYVFFKHEDEAAGPKLATRFLELNTGAHSPPLPAPPPQRGEGGPRG